MPGTTFLPVAGPLGTMLSMLIGMIIMLIIASTGIKDHGQPSNIRAAALISFLVKLGLKAVGPELDAR